MFYRRYKKYILSVLVCLFLSGRYGSTLFSQQVLPPDPHFFDKTFGDADALLGRKDTVAAAAYVTRLDSIIPAISKDYPAYAGLVRWWQSWYQYCLSDPSEEQKKRGACYLNEAGRLLQGRAQLLWDSLYRSVLPVALRFRDAGKLDYIRPLDSLLRKSMPHRYFTAKNDYTFSFYAWKTYDVQRFEQAGFLADYDELFFKEVKRMDPLDDRFGSAINTYLWLGTRYKNWVKNNAYANINDICDDYEYYTEQLYSWLWDTAFSKNKPAHESANHVLRDNYIYVYGNYLLFWGQIAILANQTGKVAASLSTFIDNELIPHTQYARRQSIPDNRLDLLAGCTNLLAEIYNQTGQYQRSIYLMEQVKPEFQQPDKVFDNAAYAIGFRWSYYLQNCRSYIALRSTGGNIYSDIVRLMAANPGKENATTDGWGQFLYARALTIEYLISAGKAGEAIDSSIRYIDEVLLTDSAYNKVGQIPFESIFFYTIARALTLYGKYETADEALRYAFISYKADNIGEIPYYPQMLALRIRLSLLLDKSYHLETDVPFLLRFTKSQLTRNLVSLPPDQRILFYENKLQPYFDLYHTLLAENIIPVNTALADSILEQSISLKSLLNGNYFPLIEEMEPAAKKQIAASSFSSMRKIDMIATQFLLLNRPDDYIKALSVYNSFNNILEGLVSRSMKDSLYASFRVSQLYKVLQPGDLYAEFIRFNHVLKKDSAWYAALLLEPGTKAPVFRKLFSEKHLFKMAEGTIQGNALSAAGQRGLKVGNTKDSTQKNANTGRLGDFIFQSLQLPADMKRFVFVPDGWLNRISFAALEWKKGFFFQQYTLKQLSAAGQLLQPARSRPDTIQLLLAGGIQYDRENCTGKGGYFSRDVQWDYLPGSLKEIERLQKLADKASYPVSYKKFTELPDSLPFQGYTHLHLATHGFYFDTADVKQFFNPLNSIHDIKQMPLSRSGLVLSNANCPENTVNGNNGYLLGYELAASDLTNCRLVVLSACESALGDIKSNMGVAGLQRALKLAGAGKLLITLWKIPDKETGEFMEHFYSRLLNGSAEEEALRYTQLIMSKKYSVSTWGAFVLIE